MFRYVIWGLLGAAALTALLVPTAPASKADIPAAVPQDHPALSLTLSK